MRILVLVLLLLAAHFSLTPFAPAEAGKATFYWPFAADTRSWWGASGNAKGDSRSALTPALAGIAGLALLAAAFGLAFGTLLPAAWWPVVVAIGALASIALYALFAGWWAVLPVLIDLVLLGGVVLGEWTMTGLRGG